MSDNSEEERKTGVKGAVYPQSIEEQMRISRGCMDGQIGRHSSVSDEEAAAEYERRTPEEHTYCMGIARRVINEAKAEEVLIKIKTSIETSEGSPDLLIDHIHLLIEQYVDGKDHLQEKGRNKAEEVLMKIKNTIEALAVSPHMLIDHISWLIEEHLKSL